MTLLDDLRARMTKDPLDGFPTLIMPGPKLDDNAQQLYDHMQSLHPGKTIQVEHWTVMRVFNEHDLCIDVRRSVSA